MSIFRSIKKSFIFGFLALTFILVNLVASLFVTNIMKRRKLLAVLGHRISKIIVREFGIEVHVPTVEPVFTSFGGRAPLVVANHVSYVDVLVLLSMQPGVFVTSTEIRDTPGLGWLARAANCIFVDRIEKNRIYGEVNEISECLTNDIPVFLFPEAGSSSGHSVRPFKRAMLHAAAHATSRIFPLVIKYEAIDGQPIHDGNRNLIAFFGDMKFLSHFVRFLQVGSVRVTVGALPEVYPLPLFDSKEMAKSLQVRIQTALNSYA